MGRLCAHGAGEQHRSKRSENGFHEPLLLLFIYPQQWISWFGSSAQLNRSLVFKLDAR